MPLMSGLGRRNVSKSSPTVCTAGIFATLLLLGRISGLALQDVAARCFTEALPFHELPAQHLGLHHRQDLHLDVQG